MANKGMDSGFAQEILMKNFNTLIGAKVLVDLGKGGSKTTISWWDAQPTEEDRIVESPGWRYIEEETALARRENEPYRE